MLSIVIPVSPGASVASASVHGLCHFQRTGTREFFDDEHEAGTVVDDRVANQRLVIFHQRGDVAKDHVLVIDDANFSQVFRCNNRKHMPDAEALIRRYRSSPQCRVTTIPDSSAAIPTGLLRLFRLPRLG